jgi:exodeoxyribonuclease III
MKLVTWNVNSLTVRLNRVREWLVQYSPDVLCLQELKLETDKFPLDAFTELGYSAVYIGQKTYNGVAIISKHAAQDVQINIPGFDDPQARAIAATIDGVRIICLYTVNGFAIGSDKFEYKLKWLRECTQWLKSELKTYPQLAVLGDFNIAPTDADVHDPEQWRGVVLCTDEERAFFTQWNEMGLRDSFRLFDQPPKTFSWWDYRQLAFPKNLGLRIDHILLTDSLAAQCTKCWIDREARKTKGEDKPSDHAPVVAELARG